MQENTPKLVIPVTTLWKRKVSEIHFFQSQRTSGFQSDLPTPSASLVARRWSGFAEGEADLPTAEAADADRLLLWPLGKLLVDWQGRRKRESMSGQREVLPRPQMRGKLQKLRRFSNKNIQYTDIYCTSCNVLQTPKKPFVGRPPVCQSPQELVIESVKRERSRWHTSLCDNSLRRVVFSCVVYVFEGSRIVVLTMTPKVLVPQTF